MNTINIFWFRRDLRLDDNAGLYHALKSNNPVQPIFIFDTNILDQLPGNTDRRVEFIHDAVMGLQQQLNKLGSTLVVYHDTPLNAFKQLVKQYTISALFTNHDYEPYARERDESIARFLKEHDIAFHTYKDQVIFERNEVVKDDGKPYTIFTPYSKKWKAKLNNFYVKGYPTKKYYNNFHQQAAKRFPSLKANGNWQWAAGCGCDAAPYFRIFNPYTQTKKFDPELTYIKKWVPEFEEFTYPAPIVDHETARQRCLETYKKGLNRK